MSNQRHGMVIWRGRRQHDNGEYRVVLVPRTNNPRPMIVVESHDLDATGAERWNEMEFDEAGEEIHDEVIEQAINDLVGTLQQTNAAFEKVKAQLQPPTAPQKTDQEKFRDSVLDGMDAD